MADVGLNPTDIDGVATAGETPVTITHYFGITPKWVDGTAVAGCSFVIHVPHAAAVIASGLCDTVLITHGESGRSGVGAHPNVVSPASSSSPMGQWAADFAHDSRIALHEDLWADARAIGDGLGGAARMGGAEPSRHLQLTTDDVRGRCFRAPPRLLVHR
jgi:hypothetical protein